MKIDRSSVKLGNSKPLQIARAAEKRQNNGWLIAKLCFRLYLPPPPFSSGQLFPISFPLNHTPPSPRYSSGAIFVYIFFKKPFYPHLPLADTTFIHNYYEYYYLNSYSSTSSSSRSSSSSSNSSSSSRNSSSSSSSSSSSNSNSSSSSCSSSGSSSIVYYCYIILLSLTVITGSPKYTNERGRAIGSSLKGRQTAIVK